MMSYALHVTSYDSKLRHLPHLGVSTVDKIEIIILKFLTFSLELKIRIFSNGQSIYPNIKLINLKNTLIHAGNCDVQ
jgi:hypothetical protein